MQPRSRGCANNQKQLLIGLHTWAADNDGKFPPASGYGIHTQPRRGIRGSGDFFDVLVPEIMGPEPDTWYCPGGSMFPDSGYNSGVRNSISNTVWDFDDHQPRNAQVTEIVCVNMTAKGGYTDIARKPSDPADWVVVNDDTFFDIPTDMYLKGAHPGLNAHLGIGSAVRGRNGPAAPRGVNTGTVDGSVKWTPRQEAMLGWSGCGGGLTSFLLCRQLEPPRPGRPGMLP